MGGALEKAAKKMFLRSCGCLRDGHQQHNQTFHVLDTVSPASSPSECLMTKTSSPCKNISSEAESHKANSSISTSSSSSSNKNLCTICLDPLSYSLGSSPGQAIFTAQCSHAFHFACISSNVQHGSITCPICRAHWTQLPRDLKPRHSLRYNKSDPILQILDNSIATSRVHRQSFLLSAQYDDDDSIDPDLPGTDPLPRLSFSLLSVSDTPYLRRHGRASLNSATAPSGTYLNVKLSQQPAIDLVLIASPNGPNLRLMKQMMALVVFSLRPVDRLAVVTYSSSAARAFPLRRMSSYGKRTALRVVDRLFYSGSPAESMEALKKGVKILQDRAHKNPQSCIFHLTDNPSSSYYDPFDAEVPFAVHRFNVRLGFGVSGGFVMQGFEDFLAGALGGGVRSVRLRIGDDGGFFGIGELRGGEERSFPVAEQPMVRVEYSYVECGDEEGSVIKGEAFVRLGDKGDCGGGGGHNGEGGLRMSSAECSNWDYHDALMARRWAKHLHR